MIDTHVPAGFCWLENRSLSQWVKNNSYEWEERNYIARRLALPDYYGVLKTLKHI